MTAALRARRLAAGAAAGIVATLAIPSLAAAGNVLAWGDNSGAQLGNGSTASLSLTPVQVQLPAGAMVRAIMAGAVHALARAAKGHVLAWGFNDHGQIGDGSDNLRVPPVRVKLGKGLAAIAIGTGPDAETSLAIVRSTRP